MSVIRPLLSIALFSLAACGASEAPPRPADVSSSKVVVASQAPEGYDTCVAAFQRQRECTSDYIPALVDARVRADVPPGIAEKDRTDGREALIQLAMTEWQSDSTDEAIAEMCQKITNDGTAGVPELIRKAEACLSESECPAFSACAVDIVASRWAD
jgi:hypothetical protein